MDPLITSLATVPAVLALVTIFRDLGLPSKLAPLLAVTVGVLLAVGEQQLGHLPVYQAAAGGLLLGLAASGVYDASKLAGGRGEPSVAIIAPEVELQQRVVDLDPPATN